MKAVKAFGRGVVRARIPILIAALLLLIPAVYGMRHTRINYDMLDYLPADCQLLSGDLVVTSGLGGYYPAGMVIGRVQEVLPDDSGAASYALIAPQTDPDTLTEVAVIKSFDIVT